MSNYNSQLQSNNTGLQEVLETLQTKAAGGGVSLPTLTNPASESEVFLNQEYIDSTGNKKTGTFTIDNELSTQDDLITQLETLITQKAAYNTIYIGTATPTSDIGVDGDFYIVRGGV